MLAKARTPLLAAGLLAVFAFAAPLSAAEDPLPSWNDGHSKEQIVAFVEAVTDPGDPDYVAPDLRIATFDNDGTLWSEQPMYVQLAFALDRLKALAPEHPEWQETEPFKSALAGDFKALAGSGKEGLAKIIEVTHGGMSTEEFAKIVSDWIATARNPKTGMLDIQMIYQPMLELIAYLKANDFKVYIVSGGGVDFMRAWTGPTYGIPPENVVGSVGGYRYEHVDGKPIIFRTGEIDFIDDGSEKPIGIQKHIGLRPLAAFGNSDGDFEMLEWTTTGPGRRFGLIVHHDDAEREFAYDRKSSIGRLERALDAAPDMGWVVVSMKDDWKAIFPDR